MRPPRLGAPALRPGRHAAVTEASPLDTRPALRGGSLRQGRAAPTGRSTVGCTAGRTVLTVAIAVAAVLQAAPAGAEVAAPAAREPFEVFTIGDSYASGEGAPDVAGNY